MKLLYQNTLIKLKLNEILAGNPMHDLYTARAMTAKFIFRRNVVIESVTIWTNIDHFICGIPAASR